MVSGARRWRWAAVFAALLGLALDYWRWDDPPAFGPFGIPRWTLYFVVLQLLLAGAIAWLARTDWEGDP